MIHAKLGILPAIAAAGVLIAVGCSQDPPPSPHISSSSQSSPPSPPSPRGDSAASKGAEGRADALGNQPEAKAILDTLAELFRLSDEATSPAAIHLRTGEIALARKPKPRAMPPGRPTRPIPIFDPLQETSRGLNFAAEPPLAFDWAPASSEVVLAANAEGVWRINALTGERLLWLPASRWPPRFRPAQILSSSSGRVLLAEPSRALIADWPRAENLAISPPEFRFNYASWDAKGEKALGVLESLAFAASQNPQKDERIFLKCNLWNPDLPATQEGIQPLDTPAAGSLAWLAGVPGFPPGGGWTGLARQKSQFDPFPSPMLLWNSRLGAWSIAAPQGSWTDADLSAARAARAIWLRRGRAGWRAGRPWTASISSGEIMKETIVPLSERPVLRALISPDGGRIIFFPCSSSGEREGGLFAAEMGKALAKAAQGDLTRRLAELEKKQSIFRQALREAWKRETQPSGARAATPMPQNEIIERLKRMDAVFAQSLRDCLGLEADHTLSSLDELDAALDWMGGDPGAEPGIVAGIAAYYGETLRRIAAAQWREVSWPPELLTPEPDLSSSDDFLWTLHSPFSCARRAADERLSLAETARNLLAEWPQSIYLSERLGQNSAPRIQDEITSQTAAAQIAAAGSEKKAESSGHLWRAASDLARKHPARPRAFIILGEALNAEGWSAPARAAFLRAAEMDPANAEFAIAAARAAFEDADYSAALEGYRRAKILDAHGQWTETIEEALKALVSRSQENPPTSPPPTQRFRR